MRNGGGSRKRFQLRLESVNEGDVIDEGLLRDLEGLLSLEAEDDLAVGADFSSLRLDDGADDAAPLRPTLAVGVAAAVVFPPLLHLPCALGLCGDGFLAGSSKSGLLNSQHNSVNLIT